MLIVRRVEIGNIGGEGLGSVDRVELMGRAGMAGRMGEDVGKAEFDAFAGAGSP